MALYNTIVGVIANIEANSEADAVTRLVRLVEAFGFQTHIESQHGDAFLAQDGTQSTDLPVRDAR